MPSINSGKIQVAVWVRRLGEGRFECFDKMLCGTVAATPDDIIHQDFLLHQFQGAHHLFVLDGFSIVLSRCLLEQEIEYVGTHIQLTADKIQRKLISQILLHQADR